jgi:Domain of unknown function (DUF4158)
MKGDYPDFKVTYTHDELVEHFLLSPAERAVVDTCHGEVNCHGMAVLLKAVPYLGYVPNSLAQGPEAVRTFIAHQIGLLWDRTAVSVAQYHPWSPSGRGTAADRLPIPHKSGQAGAGNLAPDPWGA